MTSPPSPLPTKSRWQSLAEACQVPRGARKAFAGGVMTVAKGFAQMISNMELFPLPIRFAAIGAMMAIVGAKSGLESHEGDIRLGVNDPASALLSEAMTEPTVLANWIAKSKLTNPRGTQMLAIQALEVVVYGLGAASNAEMTPEFLRSRFSQTAKWLAGPLLGLVQTAPQLFERKTALRSALEGVAALTGVAPEPGSGFVPLATATA